MGANRELEFEGPATPSEVAEALTRIAEGIRGRSLALSLGEEELIIHPDGGLSLEVWAKEKKGKAKIEIAVAWRQPTAGTDEDEDCTMERNTFKLTRVGSPDEIADYLTSLAAGLERSQVSLESGTHALRLVPPSEIKLEIRAEEKCGTGTLKLEIRWKRPTATKLSELTIQVRPVPAQV